MNNENHWSAIYQVIKIKNQLEVAKKHLILATIEYWQNDGCDFDQLEEETKEFIGTNKLKKIISTLKSDGLITTQYCENKEMFFSKKY